MISQPNALLRGSARNIMMILLILVILNLIVFIIIITTNYENKCYLINKNINFLVYM